VPPVRCITRLTVAASLLNTVPGVAQVRLSERAVTAQTIAGTTVTIEYSRPVARGRENLFGGVVAWGEHWTPGADWATTVEVDHDVRVEGRLLPRGKYSLWTVVRPDTWTVAFHRRSRIFHTAPPDTTDQQLRLEVPAGRGPPTEVLTFDFPEIRTGGTTLRFRWGTVVVPVRFHAIPPPLRMVASRAVRTRYPGRYDLEILPGNRGITPGRRLIDITEEGDTLHWRDADGPEAERRDFILSPAGEDEFIRARRNASGEYWSDPGIVVAFNLEGNRAAGYEVQAEDGTVVARATRREE
jgi:hypothetical protein